MRVNPVTIFWYKKLKNLLSNFNNNLTFKISEKNTKFFPDKAQNFKRDELMSLYIIFYNFILWFSYISMHSIHITLKQNFANYKQSITIITYKHSKICKYF